MNLFNKCLSSERCDNEMKDKLYEKIKDTNSVSISSYINSRLTIFGSYDINIRSLRWFLKKAID